MNAPAERKLYGEPGPDGRTPFWRAPTLWAAAAGQPTISVAIADLGVLDAVVWFDSARGVEPTVRRVAERARDIAAADLAYPIIMTSAGDVLDGAHRIAKARLEGRTEILAVILDDWPPPDGYV